MRTHSFIEGEGLEELKKKQWYVPDFSYLLNLTMNRITKFTINMVL
jgi:hypothetical protein